MRQDLQAIKKEARGLFCALQRNDFATTRLYRHSDVIEGSDEERSMSCSSCGSVNQGRFPAEVSIHFQGLKNVHKLPVLVFPELLVCHSCGRAEFTIPEDDLGRLVQSDATTGSLAPAIR